MKNEQLKMIPASAGTEDEKNTISIITVKC